MKTILLSVFVSTTVEISSTISKSTLIGSNDIDVIIDIEKTNKAFYT